MSRTDPIRPDVKAMHAYAVQPSDVEPAATSPYLPAVHAVQVEVPVVSAL